MMRPKNSPQVHPYLPLLMGAIFATVTSTPLYAQPRVLEESPISLETQVNLADAEPVQAFAGQLAIFLGHEDGVNTVTFSPDGSQILTGSVDGTARLWDISGDLISVFSGHGDAVGIATFSPDGRQILIAGDNKTSGLWDTSGNLIVELLGHEDSVTSGVFSPDGRYILTGSRDKTARLWDTEGNLIVEFLGHENWISSVVFSPNGRHILTNSQDGTARLWDTSGNLLVMLRGHEKRGSLLVSAPDAVFSPDGTQILTTSEDKTARLWDTSGNLLAVFRGHEETVSSAVFSRDGRHILTASFDGTARLWDTSGNLIVELRGDKGLAVYRAIFSPDGTQILTTSSDKTARLWDTSGNLLAVFHDHQSSFISSTAVFNPEGTQILITSGNKATRLWDISVVIRAQSEQIATLQTFQEGVSKNNHQLAEFRGHEGNVHSAVFSPDGTQVLTASSDKTARLWDTSGNLLAVLQGHENTLSSNIVFSPDGTRILTSSMDKTARLWDISGNLLVVFQGHENSISKAVFSPDGTQVLTSSDDKTARLWDTSGNLLAVLQGHQHWVYSAVFSPDGRHILTASRDGTARLWDTSGNLLTMFRGHEGEVFSAVFSPDGTQILTGSPDKTARLWDTSGNLLAVLQGHESSIYSAVFSPDGTQILTSSSGTAQLWDTSGNLLAMFLGLAGHASSAVFSPDGTQVLTSSSGTAQLWDTSGNLLAMFRGLAESAVFSPDGTQILTTVNKTARLWDVSAAITAQSEQMAALQAFQEGVSKNNAQLADFQGPEEKVTSAVFSPDGRHILTTNQNGDYTTLRLWDRQGNLITDLWGHEEWIYSGVFSPDGRHIFTSSRNDEIARLWDTQGNLLGEFLGDERGVSEGVFSPDGSHILTISNNPLDFTTTSFTRNGTVRLWDIHGNLLTELWNHEQWIYSAVFSPDGRTILTNSGDQTIRLWDTSGKLLAELKGERTELNKSAGFSKAAFSPDGRYITAFAYNGLNLWDAKGNFLVLLEGYGALMGGNSVIFHPDNRHLLIISGDQTIRLWDIQGNLLSVLGEGEVSTSSAVFSPDGTQILTTIGDDTAYLWDMSGNLLAQFGGGERGVHHAAFSPDGRYILTASFKGIIRLWDSQAHLLAEFQGHEPGGLSNSTVFSADSHHILTTNRWNGTARLWDVATAINVYAPTRAFQEGIQLFEQENVESRQLTIQKLEESVQLYLTAQNSVKASETLLLVGNIYADLGQFQSALDSYNQALLLSQQSGAKEKQANLLNSLGQVYLSLADFQSALYYYEEALSIFYELNDPGGIAQTFNNIGNIHTDSKQWQNAIESYRQALIIARFAGDLAAESPALMGIGSTYIAFHEWESALNAYNQALIIVKTINNKKQQVTILNEIGTIQSALSQDSAAQESYSQALSLSRELGYKAEEARILYHQALLNRQKNNLTDAQTDIEAAINIIEDLRTQIDSEKLRQSYFAQNQAYYEFYTDLLMELHQQNPDKGYDKQAFNASERARARTLLEILAEANADIRSGIDPQLREKEFNLQQRINATESQRMELFSGEHTPEQANALKQELDTLLRQLDELRAEIRRTSPRYAALTQPQPLTSEQIQQQVLDNDTLLLQYSLGEDRSFLWAVTPDSVEVYELPPRAEIEELGEQFYQLMQNPEYRGESRNITVSPNLPLIKASATQLSQMLLSPVADKLTGKRLLVVPDGVLNFIPFAALPTPGQGDELTPLLVNHEIINLPSSSTLAILRQQDAGGIIAPKTVALIADPVFELDDKRVTGRGVVTASNSNRVVVNRSADTIIGRPISALPGTRQEAEAILALVPGGSAMSAFDFDASRATVANTDLTQYKMVHFATHGFVSSSNPELSGVVLSLVDEQGNGMDGFLRLHDIFNLQLNAQVVVLSACQTGLGDSIRGEGLVGLTRGFMYAGTPRLVVSLWSVDDNATAALMSKFYEKMLSQNLTPAQALRQAQLEMSQTQEWNSPYYWAGFTLQGEWR